MLQYEAESIHRRQLCPVGRNKWHSFSFSEIFLFIFLFPDPKRITFYPHFTPFWGNFLKRYIFPEKIKKLPRQSTDIMVTDVHTDACTQGRMDGTTHVQPPLSGSWFSIFFYCLLLFFLLILLFSTGLFYWFFLLFSTGFFYCFLLFSIVNFSNFQECFFRVSKIWGTTQIGWGWGSLR